MAKPERPRQPAAARAPRAPQLVARFKPVAGLGRVVIVVAIVWTVLGAAQAVTAPWAAATQAQAVRAGRPTDEVLTAYAALSVPLSICILVAYVTGCLFLHRARMNTLALYPDARHRRGMSWTWVGWWFPVLSLWFPYQVVRDISIASRPRGSAGPVDDDWWVPVWWLTWLVAIYGWVCADYLLGQGGQPPSLAGLTAVPWLRALAAVAQVVALVAWIRIVRRISAAQQTWSPA